MVEQWSWIFMDPVVGIPGYSDIIKKPMDLGSVKKNLGSKPSRCRFKTYEKFVKDVKLVFQNALLFNKADEAIKGSVYEAAQHLLKLFEHELEEAMKKGVFTDATSAMKGEPTKVKAEKSAHRSGKSANRTEKNAKSSSKGKLIDAEVWQYILKKLLKDDFATPFIEAVDLQKFTDYAVKISKPRCLKSIEKKMKSRKYASEDQLVQDIRLTFSNCLVYNSDAKLCEGIRDAAVHCMKVFEGLYTSKCGGNWNGVPQRWKCQYVLDKILQHQSRDDNGQLIQTAQWFKYPIETYFGSKDLVPAKYFDVVKQPMDFGTVSENLHMAVYKKPTEFIEDLKLVSNNCILYWKSNASGKTYCKLANSLLKVIKTCVAEKFSSKEVSSPATGSKTPKPSKQSSAKNVIPPKKEILLSVLQVLKNHHMETKFGSIRTCGPFMRGVDASVYPDYREIVKEPMDISKIERRVKSNRYASYQEFKSDMELVFSNCRLYNSDPEEGADIRTMADELEKCFLKEFQSIPVAELSVPEEVVEVSDSAASAFTEIIKQPKEESKKRKAPNEVEENAVKVKKQKNKGKKHKVELEPLTLEEPEASCDKILRRCFTIPFVKNFHFDVPVYEAIPSIKEEYFQTIAQPMDLTEVRSRLQHGTYHGNLRLFESDGKLVFKNAISYYAGDDDNSKYVRDAAEHILAFFMHACYEYLPYEENNARVENEAARIARQKEFREKRGNIVHAAKIRAKGRECQRLLRTLCSHKYEKLCWPFRDSVHVLFPNIPSVYFEIIPKLMDLKTVQDKVHKDEYETYGEFIDDVRLTFRNSLVYNKGEAEKEGWTVYFAASEMMKVCDELWAEITLSLFERIGRDEVIHREQDRKLAIRLAADAIIEKEMQQKRLIEYQEKLRLQRIEEEKAEEYARIHGLPKEAESLKINNRSMTLVISKEDRKAEDRKRKKEKREKDIAVYEQRVQASVTVTAEAIREAEGRSRKRARLYQQEIQAKQKKIEEEAAKEKLRLQQLEQAKKFDPQLWNAMQSKSKTFWKVKKAKLGSRFSNMKKPSFIFA